MHYHAQEDSKVDSAGAGKIERVLWQLQGRLQLVPSAPLVL